jgi:putative ABC transport system permease protein
MTRQRAKEISIRKVFGSSKKQIVILLTKEIYFLLVVSYVLSMPFACYVTNEWLNSFAYRINLIDEWLTLVFAGVTVVSIATLTLIYYIEKVTRTNPAEVLRDE